MTPQVVGDEGVENGGDDEEVWRSDEQVWRDGVEAARDQDTDRSRGHSRNTIKVSGDSRPKAERLHFL